MRTKKLSLLVLFIISMFIFGCSDNDSSTNLEIEQEDNATFLQRANSVIDLKSEYKLISETKDYKDYLSSLKTFNINLGVSNQNKFIDENNLVEWLITNINQTNFLDYNSAISNLNETKYLYKKVLEANSTFFEKVEELEEDSKLDLYTSIIEENPYIDDNLYETYSGPCENECINDGVDCGRAADNAYAGAMAVSGGLFWSGNVTAAATVAVIASINHSTAQRGCARALNACMRGCGW